MTSQKRYRHHQDNNSRFKDLPPRFKRQKSSSSPTPPCTEPSVTQVSETPKSSVVNKTIERTDIPHFVVPPVSLSSPVMLVENYSGRDRLCGDIFQAPPPVVTSTWSWPIGTDIVPVLSEMDNRVAGSHSPHMHVPLGTHFGYRPDSPPISPWSVGGMTNITGPHGIHGSSAWSVPQADQFSNCSHLSLPGFPNNENRASRQLKVSQISSGSQWDRTPFSPLPNHSLSPVDSLSPSSLSPSSVKSTGKVKNQESKRTEVKRDADYSDPDIRTIEMLRELERVADQKENDNDFGADRKSLVSHHLRMLMCAVDRYTEGIEDGIAYLPRADEVVDSPASSPGSSSGLSKMWQEQKDVMAKKSTVVKNQRVWATSCDSALSPILGDNVQRVSSTPSPHSLKMLPSPQMSTIWKGLNNQESSMWKEKKTEENQEAPGWDLWSSPSFDFCGVLTSRGSK